MIAMATMNFKQDINHADADKFTSWLNRWKEMQDVLCNQETKRAVFAFYR